MQETAGPGCQQRLMSTLDTYFQAIMQQADDRGSRNIPELEEYILLRRDTSGCKTGFAFIEYAANIDLPDDVIEHPIIKALSDATNDLVSWANVSVRVCLRKFISGSPDLLAQDVLSYNAEQARGDVRLSSSCRRVYSS